MPKPEPTFVTGLFYKKPHPKAPEYVLGNLSAKREEFIAFLTLQTGEWVNMVIKESKAGKAYVQIDDWKPKQKIEEEIDYRGKPDTVIGDDGQEVPF